MRACCVYHLPLSKRWGLSWAFVFFFINLMSLTVSTPDKASDGIGPKKGSRGNLIGQGWNKERWRAQLLFEALQKKTLYQHWRQFTPQFIGGAINRLVWGFCNRYSPQLLWACLHPPLPILFPIAQHPILLLNIVSRSRSRMLGEETRDWKLVKLNFWVRTQLPLIIINNRLDL